MNIQDRDRIKYLSKRIESNIATAEDYEQYQSILVRNGLSREQILDVMRSHGINSYNDYIVKRNEAKTFKDKNTYEAVVLGALLGFGLGLLLGATISDKKTV